MEGEHNTKKNKNGRPQHKKERWWQGGVRPTRYGANQVGRRAHRPPPVPLARSPRLRRQASAGEDQKRGRDACAQAAARATRRVWTRRAPVAAQVRETRGGRVVSGERGRCAGPGVKPDVHPTDAKPPRRARGGGGRGRRPAGAAAEWVGQRRPRRTQAVTASRGRAGGVPRPGPVLVKGESEGEESRQRPTEQAGLEGRSGRGAVAHTPPSNGETAQRARRRRGRARPAGGPSPSRQGQGGATRRLEPPALEARAWRGASRGL